MFLPLSSPSFFFQPESHFQRNHPGTINSPSEPCQTQQPLGGTGNIGFHPSRFWLMMSREHLVLPRHWEERKRSNHDDGGIQDGFNGENYRKDTTLEFPAWKSLPQQGWVALNGSRGWERAGPRERE